MLKEYKMSDEEICRSAETLIRAHGERAGIMSDETAERWRKRGDQSAAELWTRIAGAVRKLQLKGVGFNSAQ